MLKKILNVFKKNSDQDDALLAGKKILIIEDGEIERKFMDKTLQNYDCEVHLAEDGETGVEKAKALIPDLIILDYRLPGIDGKQVCEMIKNAELTRNIPVIFLTGSTNSSDVVNCFEVGADHFLKKPISASMLVRQIKLILSEKVTKEGE